MTVTCVNDPPAIQDQDFVDAAGDRNAIGNTTFKVGVAAGAGPEKVIAGVSLLDGASDVEGDTFLVTSVQDGTLSEATDQGGTVTANADGTFTYEPPAGFEGTDTFTYQVTDDGTAPASASATVSIEVIDMVWYVDSANGTAGADGTAIDPFAGLADLDGGTDVDGPGDTIFLYEGTSDGTPTGAYVGPLPLEAGQSLIGELAGLTVDGVALVAPGGAAHSTITSPTGAGVSISAGALVRRVEVDTTGTTQPGFLVTGSGTVTFDRVVADNTDDDGIRVVDLNGSVTVTNSVIRDSGDDGINMSNAAALLTATIIGTTVENATGFGIRGATTAAGAMDVTVNGAVTTIDQSGGGVSLTHAGAGVYTFLVDGTVVTGTATSLSGVNVNRADSGSGAGTMSGTIENTTLSSADTFADGIRVVNTDDGQLTVRIDNNTISDYAEYGILARTGDGSGRLDVTVTNNNVNLTDVLALDGIHVQTGVTGTDTSTICAAVSGNDAESAGRDSIRLRQRFANTTFRLQGYGGVATNTAVVQTYVGNTNPASGGSITAIAEGPGYTNAVCATP